MITKSNSANDSPVLFSLEKFRPGVDCSKMFHGC